jgi:hypothetical protein
MPAETHISARAKAIADGLMRTGRASDPQAVQGHLQLRAKRGSGFYWIAASGSRLLRGDELDSAEEIQENFVQAMVLAGRGK